MRKTSILRLTRLFTAMAAVVGIALHPASKLVDGVSGATRLRQEINNDTSNSDNSSTTKSNSNITNYNSNPTITAGWGREGTNWEYIRKDGSKATGWLNDGGKWYYLSSNGVMLTGWIQTDGHWYYLASSGAMQTGWIKDSSGSWYYLDASGAMLANTTIGGYTLGSDGRML
ncbi:hypothetical protein [Clostridium sp.]|uniref:hypothetical protein n=1 Tax=Clostridium sp. TaxID=1506 RepID=UPI00284110F3|nr:hypothetical protein [Clostridium sp.]MDR3595033.1 hypothetical protein [Clostridium sp.]